jgi:transposase
VIEKQGGGGAISRKAYSLCLLTALDQDPPFLFDIVEGSCNGCYYVDFWSQAIRNKWVRPGDIVIVDNCKTHASCWSADVVETLLTDLGVQYVLLPAYSPELNPAELVFSKSKNICQNIQTQIEILQGILYSLRQVSVPNMMGWYERCLVKLAAKRHNNDDMIISNSN